MHYNEYYAVKMARQLMQVQTGSKWGGGGHVLEVQKDTNGGPSHWRCLRLTFLVPGLALNSKYRWCLYVTECEDWTTTTSMPNVVVLRLCVG